MFEVSDFGHIAELQKLYACIFTDAHPRYPQVEMNKAFWLVRAELGGQPHKIR